MLFKKPNANLVKTSLERNLRSVNVLFRKKRTTEKNKLPALKLNQLLTKRNFSNDRKFCLKEKRAKLNLTLKLLFQNFPP